MNRTIEVRRIEPEEDGNCHVCGRGAESRVRVAIQLEFCGMEFHLCPSCALQLNSKVLSILSEGLK